MHCNRSYPAFSRGFEDALPLAWGQLQETLHESQDQAFPVRLFRTRKSDKTNVEGLAGPAEARLPYRERRFVSDETQCFSIPQQPPGAGAAEGGDGGLAPRRVVRMDDRGRGARGYLFAQFDEGLEKPGVGGKT